MAQAPEQALASDLRSGAKVVLAVLWSFVPESGGRFVWPSRPALGEACGLKERALRGHLKELREKRWLTPATEDGRRGWLLHDTPVPRYRPEPTPEPMADGPEHGDLSHSILTVLLLIPTGTKTHQLGGGR